jgi:hypothetical protein
VSRSAFLEAERNRRSRLAVSSDQRRTLKRLALKAGVEMPRVYSMKEASDAIDRLKGHLTQPMLEGFRTPDSPRKAVTP